MVAQNKMLAGLNPRHSGLDNFRPPATLYGPETKKSQGIVYTVMYLDLSNEERQRRVGPGPGVWVRIKTSSLRRLRRVVELSTVREGEITKGSGLFLPNPRTKFRCLSGLPECRSYSFRHSGAN